MKTSSLAFGVALCATGAFAFPALTPEDIKDEFLDKLEKRIGVPGFNAKEQYVSTSGIHRYIPANFAAGDQRGPCPGLNALANHGYLPRSGYGPIEVMAAGTVEGVGLGEDIAQIFSIYGAFSSGDGLSWSIGGPPPGGILSNVFPGFFGKPFGISFSHNEYEGDGSAARDDLYQQGNDYELNIGYFKELYDQLPASSINALSQHRGKRVQQAISGNPYFFQGPFTGIGVVGAANSFVFRLFANKSAEYPQGLLTKDVYKSWCGVTGPDNNLKWIPGTERIPDNWYKRSLQDQYTLPLAFADLAIYAAQHPNTAVVGGNMGKVNTFTGVDPANLTGGVFNAQNLLQGNNLGCFTYQAAAFAAPDFLSKKFSNVETALAALTAPITKGLASLNCPQLKKLDMAQLNQFPGYKKSENGDNGYPGPIPT